VPAQVHVVGAGLAGLSCAVRLAGAGQRVSVYEAAGHAGGRCRSFHDEALGRTIDNGNHLLLSGNRAALAYLREIGAADSLAGPEPAAFPFLDLKTGHRWTVRPGAGWFPWWIFDARRRVPETAAGDYLRGLGLAWAGARATVAQCLVPGTALYRRFWEPLCVAVLNTAAEEAAATLLWPVLRETFGRGEAACRPLIARHGLGQGFVDPALRFLEARGASVSLNRRLRALNLDGDRVSALAFGGAPLSVGPEDSVVLAVPPAASADLVPDLVAPRHSRAIVNGHFRLDRTAPGVTFLGLVGGTCQWLFVRGDIASVTASAADALAEEPAAAIAERMWPEVAGALDLGAAPLPAHRIVKEKRATFAQTPEEAARRPGARTAWRNLFLAGDWTDTGLPATIEGSVCSGRKAADMVLSSRGDT
jgi:squalene-associated FAD-dependent desaturase